MQPETKKLRKLKAWYPSAGGDFRPLIYLSPSYMGTLGSSAPTPVEHFLFTDYWPWCTSPKFLTPGVIFSDRRTCIEVTRVEELRPMRLPVHPDLVHFPNHHHLTNRVFNLDVRILSDDHTRTVLVTYAFVENTAMASDLICKGATVAHIVSICYGSGFGGSAIRGNWLLHAATSLKATTYISDRSIAPLLPTYCTDESTRALELYPSIPNQVSIDLEEIHTCRWGNHSTHWYHMTNLNQF